MKKRLFLIFTIVIASISLYACSININGNKLGLNKVEDKSEKRVNAQNIKGLYVTSPVGSVKVSTWDKNEILVNVTKINNGIKSKSELLDDLKNVELVYNEDNGNFVVKAFLPKFKDNGISVDFDISVPKNLGEFKINSDVGDVRLAGLQGKIDVVNSVGKIDLNDCAGAVSLKATTGDITVRGCKLNGDSNITGNTGRVLFDGSIGTSGTYKFVTNVGKMDVTLPSNASFDVDASTDVGNIECKFNVSGSTSNKKVQGKVNGGGPKLILVNNIGSISLQGR